MNLRHGMFVAYAFQVAVISVDLVISYINISNPNLQIFFFAKGVELNGPAILVWVTGILTVLVGGFALLKKSSAGTVRLWMILSFALVPLQFCYGGLYCYRCLMIYQDLTPSIAVTNVAIQTGMSMYMPKMDGMVGLGGPAGESRDQVKEKFNKRFPEGQKKFEMQFFDQSAKSFSETPPEKKGWFSGVRGWFKSKGKSLQNWMYSKTGITRSGLIKGFLAAVVVASLIVGSVIDEFRIIYGLLPPPVQDYYKAGYNFMQVFGLRCFLFVFLFLLIAIHISSYAAVKARGGTGDEMVGYSRIRWFYNQPGEIRRKIRAGANLFEMRTADKNMDSDDSGSDLEGEHDADVAHAAAIAGDLERKRHRIKI